MLKKFWPLNLDTKPLTCILFETALTSFNLEIS